MAKCKNCKHCQVGDVYTICEVLKTHCLNTEDPDLGTRFPACKYSGKKKEKEEEVCQNASTSGKDEATESAASSAEKS
jgi:hypothetical protein